VREVVDQIQKPNGLYPNYLNPRSGVWGSRKYYYWTIVPFQPFATKSERDDAMILILQNIITVTINPV
jgi:hypothetical protein